MCSVPGYLLYTYLSSTGWIKKARKGKGKKIEARNEDPSEWLKGTHYSASPDDKTFILLANSYASLHPQMNTSTEFTGGITNGAAWYPLSGGMQVSSYFIPSHLSFLESRVRRRCSIHSSIVHSVIGFYLSFTATFCFRAWGCCKVESALP